MTVLVRPGAFIVAAFVAGSGAGAAGLHWVTQGEGERAPGPAVAPSSPGQRAETKGTRSEDVARSGSIDRAALRAALAELLAEEEEASRDLDEEEAGQGESAGEALMRLERAYRAELEEQARRTRDEEVAAALDARESAESDSVSSHRSALVNEPADGSEGLDAREPRADDGAALPVEDRIAENHPGPRRDGEATAQPREAERVAVVTQVQPLFFAPVGLPQPALGIPPGAQVPRSSLRSPLSKPPQSAHEQSPWSPIDYSRHHNPWGPTFGRRVP